MGISDIRFGRKRQTHVYSNAPNAVYLGDTRNLSAEDKQTVRKYRSRHGGNYETPRSQATATAQMLTHEQVHHTLLKQAPRGQKDAASRALDRPGRPYVYQAVNRSATCRNCGDNARHMHGRHGCCGRMNCHIAISGSHLVAGERGLRSGLLAPMFEWRLLRR